MPAKKQEADGQKLEKFIDFVARAVYNSLR